MRMYDIIAKKRDGFKLSRKEIDFFIDGYTKGDIPDYQASALLMAIYLNGMSAEETAQMTDSMAASGENIDLSEIEGIKVDKHSTGGVGDKTTLIAAPIAAACGVPIAKMSGRGLGHTGGTADKLESIPGFRTVLSVSEFIDAVKSTGICLATQTGNLAPADKKLYSLRDVTATVGNISLIAASIMSKKIAAGCERILLDVKTGSGALVKSFDESVRLAKTMVEIGERVGRKTIALITNMDSPLGTMVGNSLEVMEAVETLKGKGPHDLTDISITLAANMLYLAQKGDAEHCKKLANEALYSGSALSKFVQMIKNQGGDTRVIDNFELLPSAHIKYEVKSQREGYIFSMQTDRCGMVSVLLGAGREKKDSSLDLGAGLEIIKKTGDYINKGETVARFYTSKPEVLNEAEALYLSALNISDKQPPQQKLILERIE